MSSAFTDRPTHRPVTLGFESYIMDDDVAAALAQMQAGMLQMQAQHAAQIA